MMTERHLSSRKGPVAGRRAPALLALCALWVLLACVPALAHSRLLEASPSEGETLSSPPERVRLTFNEPVEAEFDPVEVYDARDRRVDLDDARVASGDPKTVVVGLEDLSPGTYTVEWRVSSADGHPIAGSYRFTVRGGETTGASPAEEDGGVRDPVEQSAAEESEGRSFAGLVVAVLAVGAAVAVAGGILAARRR